MQHDLQDHQRRADRIEKLIQDVASYPDAQARAITEELMQSLLDMYGEALARILELTAQNEVSGQALIEMFAHDELISSLFLLHGLHPIDIETRVARALVEARPYFKSHGCNVELVKIENGVAFVRLEGSDNGRHTSTITLQQTIEEAIYNAAPDLDGLQVEGINDLPRRTGIPVTFVPPRRHKESIHARE
jgi:Fe-S cluster biogenesis protein NfuA